MKYRFASLLFLSSLAVWNQTVNSTFTSSGGAVDLTPNNSGQTGVASATAPHKASVYPIPVTVSGLTGSITAVSVRLNGFSHTDPDDLDMLLVGPGGQKFVFMTDSGGFAATGSVSNITFTITDSAASLLPTGAGLVNNASFKPAVNSTTVANTNLFPAPAPATSTSDWAVNAAAASSATFATKFNGLSGASVNGTWNLYIAIDGDGGPDNGSLTSWSLLLTTQNNTAATTTSLTSTQNPSFVGNSVTLIATVTSGGNPVTGGSVSFIINGVLTAANVPVNASGQASFNTSTLTERTHTVVGTYNPGTGFATSNGTLIQVVDRQTTVTGSSYCNTGSIVIPNQLNGVPDQYPSKVFVTGLSGSLSKVTLSLLGFSHPVLDDVEILLYNSATGARFTPFSRVGGAGAAITNQSFVLDDTAANQLPFSGSVTGGTFRPTAEDTASPYSFPSPAPAGPFNFAAPEGSSTFANSFSGSPNATWHLYVASRGAGTAGTRSIANGWCLNFITTSDPATTTVPSVNPTPSDLNQVVTVSAAVTVASNGQPVTAGTLTFKEGNTTLQSGIALSGSGVGSFLTSGLSQGAHFLTAEYSGAPGFNLSSGTVLHFVDASTTVNGLQFCNNSGMTIPDLIGAPSSVYPSRIRVSGVPGTVNAVTMSLSGLTLPNAPSADMILTGPAGGSFSPWSDISSGAVSNLNITLSDSATNQLPNTAGLSSGSFRPANYLTGADTFPAPAPSVGTVSPAPTGTATFGSVFTNSNPNGYWSLFATSDSSTGSNLTSSLAGWCVNFTVNPPDLTITKTHSGNFTQGQAGAQYTVTVTNNGPGSTGGTVTVVDTAPTGMTIASMSGQGWTCNANTCTTSQVVAAGQNFPPITVSVNIANDAPASLTNTVTVSGGGDQSTGNNTASDVTTITQAANLTISKSHSGNFVRGGSGTFTLVVTNAGLGATSGTVTVQDLLPSGLTATAISGTDWTCVLGTLSCTRSNALASGGSYPAITVSVNVAADAALALVNQAVVSGGGELNTSDNVATDPVVIGVLTLTVNVPAQAAFTFDGNAFTGSQTINVVPGNFTLATSTPQNVAQGTRLVFSNWSNLGAISQIVNITSSSVTITGNFTTEHQLTLAASPSNGGTVTPASGTFFNAGSIVNVTAAQNAGFTFANWTGAVANPNAAATTVTMDAPKSLTANFTAAAPVVTGQLTLARGTITFNRTTNRFQQVVRVTNNGAALSAAAYVLDSLPAGVTLVGASGTTSVAAPAGSPYRELGPIGAGATVSVTLEFTRIGTPAINYTARVLGSGPR